MALLSFRGFDTPSLQAQGEQRLPLIFNIQRGNARTADLKGLVIHYNAHGYDGHYDCCGDGRAPSRLEAQGGRTDPIRMLDADTAALS